MTELREHSQSPGTQQEDDEDVSGKGIVVACNPDDSGFTKRYAAALQAMLPSSPVYVGRDYFWDSPSDVGLLHLEWPEALVDWREPSETDLDSVRRRLSTWKAGSTIVATVHNTHPHRGDSQASRRLFRLVYESCHGIIHLGTASLDWFHSEYPDLAATPATTIPLGVCDWLPNPGTRRGSRNRLGLEDDESIVVSVGTIRSTRELQLLWRAFSRVPIRHKRLLVVGRLGFAETLFERFLARAKRHLSAKVRVIGFVPDADLYLYLDASDVLSIARGQILNSGSLPLGFTFGKVVVGPDSGNVGAILRSTGNPTYTPNDHRAFARALTSGLKLARQGKGDFNKAFALGTWSWPALMDDHLRFFQSLGFAARRPAAEG